MTSTIKVNNIQNQCGQNIINENSNTITIGASGDTIALASGASQSGFGRTGAVDWQTTKKTANFTAASGEGYFCDTAASGAFTLTLPSSPSAGNIVALKDYNNNFATANLTIGRGGSPINGGSGADPVINTDGASIVLVYVDASQGWVATQDDSSIITGSSFISATGGTITEDGNFKVHTFTGPGTFTVSCLGSGPTGDKVDYVVVAGGGGSGWDGGGGGGAGGYREGLNPGSYTASPLATTALTVTATGFPITVGAGGPVGSPSSGAPGVNGSNSVFSTITSAGGGGGSSGPENGSNGGSGGGGYRSPCSSGGTGNTPPVSPAQGTNGGNGDPGNQGAGGGGGATAAGTNGASPSAGPGGAGATSSINGTPTARAGGGGGGADGPSSQTGGTGGAGGGGTGGKRCGPGNSAGTVNTGGGAGGGGAGGAVGLAGGSGIVIIRYRFQ
jgi:hypothetical protein